MTVMLALFTDLGLFWVSYVSEFCICTANSDNISFSIFPSPRPTMQFSPSTPFLELAIFRFEDICIDVQEGMEGFLKTAAIEKKSGIEATMKWLRRRQVRIALLTDYDRDDLLVLLDRLGWGIAEDQLIQIVVLGQGRKVNPVKLAFEAAGVASPQQALLVADTSRLLYCATAAGLHLVFGVTNGRSTYLNLAQEPFRALLDSTLQLPNYLLRNLPEENPYPFARQESRNEPPRLWYPASGA